MRKSQKLTILKRMRYQIEECGVQGLCIAYVASTNFTPLRSSLIDLGLFPPKKQYGHGYWWSPRNKASRLKAIDKAIKKIKYP